MYELVSTSCLAVNIRSHIPVNQCGFSSIAPLIFVERQLYTYTRQVSVPSLHYKRRHSYHNNFKVLAYDLQDPQLYGCPNCPWQWMHVSMHKPDTFLLASHLRSNFVFHVDVHKRKKMLDNRFDISRSLFLECSILLVSNNFNVLVGIHLLVYTMGQPGTHLQSHWNAPIQRHLLKQLQKHTANTHLQGTHVEATHS